MKLGSLFDGSGGFPLAGSLCGIEPVWAAEIEPYPIAVTKSRFPKMKHLGNICNINGAEIEPVDIITFGSPCQDLSVAGKRAGLKHEDNGDEERTRSGLFMEAVRIIKEMRSATNGRYPTFALWENVPGAFSSNQGEDFRIVLEELIKIAEPTAKVPAPPNGGWAYSDIYLGDGWSLAYRVFDAQYWGVPQRRRRIHLVADLRGGRAGEVLFKPESLRGYSAESGEARQGVAGDAQNCVGADDREGENGCLTPLDNQSKRVYSADGVFGSLYAGESSGQCQQAVAYGISSFESNAMKSANPHSGIYEADTARTLDLNGGNPACNQGGIAIVKKIVLDDQGGSQINVRTDGKAPTIRAEMHGNVPCVMEAAGFCTEHSAQSRGIGYEREVAPTLRAGVTPALVYSIENHPADSRVDIDESGKVQTLTSRRPAVAFKTYQKVTGPLMANSHPGSYTGQDAFSDMLVAGEEPIAIDRAFFNQGQNAQYDPQYYTDGTVPTLVAKGPSAVCHKQEVRYIVRRMTPTECARLQGFPDKWGHPDPKTELTDEEYAFWTEVRVTHAVINGKEPKTYSREQILKWYNGLHTDSAEYKMWGNGIALPPALFCMLGMAQALEVAT